MKFVAIKKGMTTNFFSPLSFVTVFGSEIRDPEWVKIRIRDKHPGSATLQKPLGKNTEITTFAEELTQKKIVVKI